MANQMVSLELCNLAWAAMKAPLELPVQPLRPVRGWHIYHQLVFQTHQSFTGLQYAFGQCNRRPQLEKLIQHHNSKQTFRKPPLVGHAN